jgi:hypothetical protein
MAAAAGRLLPPVRAGADEPGASKAGLRPLGALRGDAWRDPGAARHEVERWRRRLGPGTGPGRLAAERELGEIARDAGRAERQAAPRRRPASGLPTPELAAPPWPRGLRGGD